MKNAMKFSGRTFERAWGRPQIQGKEYVGERLYRGQGTGHRH